MKQYKIDLLLLAGIALLTFLYFIDFLILKRVLYEGDAALVGYAVQYYAAWSMKQGIFPFWNPYFYYGYPSFAESQGGILYPSHLLFYLFPLSGFRYLFHLNIALHFLWTGLGVYIWMRQWTGNPWASAFAALTYEFSGYMTGHIVHPNIVEISSWAPWILWMWDRWRQRPHFSEFFLLTLFLTFQILAGHYTTFLFFLMGFALYAFVFSIVDACSHRRFRLFLTGISGFFLPVFTAHFLAAIQVFPQVELMVLSSRVGAPSIFGIWYGLRDLLYLLKPYSRGEISYEVALFIGYPALMVLLIGFLPVRPLFQKRSRLPFFLFGLIAVFFAYLTLGFLNPLGRYLLSIPPVSMMRNLARFFQLTDLFFSSATAFALAEILQVFSRHRVKNLVAVGLILLQTLSLFQAHFRLGETTSAHYYEETPSTVAFVKSSAHLQRIYSAGVIPPHLRRYEHFLIQWDGQVLPSEMMSPYFAHRFQVEYVPETIQLFIPRRHTNFIYRFINQQSKNLYNLTGTRYIILPSGKENYTDFARKMGFKKVHTTGYADIYENPGALPKAFLVYRVEVIPPVLKTIPTYVDSRLIQEKRVWDVSGAGKRLLAADVDPASLAIVEEPVPLPSRNEPASSQRPEVKILSYTPNRVEMSVRTPVAGFLVLTDSYYPGWRAEVNGKPVKIYRTDDIFRGILVPAGTSTILFTFLPTHFYLGLSLSLLTLFFLLSAYLRRKRAGSSA